MAIYVGNKIGTSKERGILDLYAGNTQGTAYAGFSGSQYSLQPGNGTRGGAVVVGGYEADQDDNIQSGKHSGKYAYEYQGRGVGHNDMEVFDRAVEKPMPPVYYG